MLAEQDDRVLLEPAGLLGGVAVVDAEAQALGVLVEAVGDHLDQRGALAAAGALDGVADGLEDGEEVLPVLDADAGDAEPGGALGDDAGGDGVRRGGQRVLVVLAEEDHRQVPHAGHVHRLVEAALVGGAVAEEGQGDAAVAQHLARQRGTGGDRDGGADDAGLPQAADVEVGQVQRPALPAADAGALAHQLGHERAQGRALADRVAVAAVVAGHVVVVAERHRGADHLGLLADARVHRAGDLPALHHLGRALVEAADAQHPSLRLERRRSVHGCQVHWGSSWIRSECSFRRCMLILGMGALAP
ncbi:MAG: hypothetical protein PGN11_06865, partial [Quadrisphaera sp.]